MAAKTRNANISGTVMDSVEILMANLGFLQVELKGSVPG